MKINCSSCVAENRALFLCKLLLLSKISSFNLFHGNRIQLIREFKSDMQIIQGSAIFNYWEKLLDFGKIL